MGKKVKLLIVDDDTKILKLMENILDRDQFDITTLLDADNIVKEIKKFSPDIVLLDIKLPGITGVEAIHSIKGNDAIKNIPVVAFTSYSMKGDREKFLKMGYDGYISKPIDTRIISKQILQNIKKK